MFFFRSARSTPAARGWSREHVRGLRAPGYEGVSERLDLLLHLRGTIKCEGKKLHKNGPASEAAFTYKNAFTHYLDLCKKKYVKR